MVGGELQLALNFDAQDIYFTFRPKFSYYQKVYRRYERFAVETKMLVPNSWETLIYKMIPTLLLTLKYL